MTAFSRKHEYLYDISAQGISENYTTKNKKLDVLELKYSQTVDLSRYEPTWEVFLEVTQRCITVKTTNSNLKLPCVYK